MVCAPHGDATFRDRRRFPCFNGGHALAYDRDILDEFADARKPRRYPEVDVALGMVVEDRASGFCGDVVTWSFEAVTLRDRGQHQRHFAWKPGGFLLEGRPVTLRRPRGRAAGRPATHGVGLGRRADAARRRWRRRAASGSRAATTPSCVEHVWGDDLRDVGIVVEPMHGIDDLVGAVEAFGPSPRRRLGILVDHLVSGSKESRLAGQVRSAARAGHRPPVRRRVGRRAAAGARPRRVAGRPARRRVEGRACARRSAPTRPASGRSCATACGTYADLRPELVGAVERLIDFVAPP